uniref:Uncharacterized protein n=1 Tax=Anguilla anguilla TaxID=7936 RepID=A0A0E9VNY6_ANGAN
MRKHSTNSMGDAWNYKQQK